ncbi:MAG: metal ABC transporter substrate-binding protein, partial [Acholeplasmataceae bacterium]
MKKLIAIPLILLSILTLSACSSKEYDIVTSLFPQYDITRTIVGDKDLTYTLLLNPGVEAHDFEPTSKQVVMINNAKLFIYTSDEMEPWAKNLENNKTTFLNLQLASNEDHDHAHAESISYSTTDEHDHVHDNLHYWVHLHNTLHMIEVILEEIIHLDEKNADYYTNNANNLKEQVRAISAKFDQI